MKKRTAQENNNPSSMCLDDAGLRRLQEIVIGVTSLPHMMTAQLCPFNLWKVAKTNLGAHALSPVAFWRSGFPIMREEGWNDGVQPGGWLWLSQAVALAMALAVAAAVAVAVTASGALHSTMTVFAPDGLYVGEASDFESKPIVVTCSVENTLPGAASPSKTAPVSGSREDVSNMMMSLSEGFPVQPCCAAKIMELSLLHTSLWMHLPHWLLLQRTL